MTLPGYPQALPVEGVIGGILIGFAGMLLLLGAGRVIGVSGLAARAIGLGGSTLGRFPSLGFLIGLPLGTAFIYGIIGAPSFSFSSPVLLALAGLLVGFGARLGSGCTSGHGVCGVSRLSQRSIVATITFMSAGIATVAVMNAVGVEVLR